MVKIPTKTRKSKIATPPKTVSTYKAAKKSEKPKTKGVSKPKVTLSANKRFDVELPCTSKQVAGIGVNLGLAYGISSIAAGSGGSNNCKELAKIAWANSYCGGIPSNNETNNNKEQLQQQQLEQPNAATAATTTTGATTLQQLTTTALATTALTPNHQATSLNAVERFVAVDAEAETQSKFRSGIRYSDVLRSKNVASNGSVKPITLHNVLPTMTPTQLMLGPSPPTAASNEVKDIDLTLFPELGQHRNCPSVNTTTGSTSVRLLQRTQANIDEDSSSPQATLERLQPSYRGGSDNNSNSSSNNSSSGGGGGNHNNNNNNLNGNNNADATNSSHHNTTTDNHDDSNEHSSSNSNCPQCTLNSLWVQHALFNSAQPYHMEIPEFNFLRADQNYPRFLGQFEDENYLKTENLALLGLKLALGGNFHSMHSNNGR